MKDVMEFGVMRELKTNNNVVDELFDAVGPEEPRLKFAFDLQRQGGNWTVSEAKQYPVNDDVSCRSGASGHLVLAAT
jgi:hypothetical protein